MENLDTPRLETALQLLQSITPAQLARVRERLPLEWIEESLAATGTATVRRRRLPAEQVIWLVLGMALMRDRPIREVVNNLDLAMPTRSNKGMASSAVSQARARLGDEPMQWLFMRAAEEWAHRSADKHRWRGLALYGADGSSLRAADSAENRAHFGGQSGRNETESGYPLLRVVVLMALRSHVLAGASFGPYDSEHVYAADLWSLVPDDSLTAVDRGFLSANLLLSLSSGGTNRHWMTRARSDSKWTTVKRLGKGDELIEMNVSSEARRKNPALGKTWSMRAVKYQRRGFRPAVVLTSLVDADAYPAAEIVAVYHERWELELGFDELKTDMLKREETLRSRSPVTVAQELWGLLLAYNLIRVEMEAVADMAKVAPTRISFVMALRYIRDQWYWLEGTQSPGAIPRHLANMREDIARFVLPPRRDRSFPRAVKLKMSNYNRKHPATGRGAK